MATLLHMPICGVIFDLDGVLVTTDEFHYQAWKALADQLDIAFDRGTNERLRGVSRMASLEIILEGNGKGYSEKEKEQLANRKNEIYKRLLTKLTPGDLMPGAMENIAGLKENGFKIAVGSSSKNAPQIMQRLGIDALFDAVVDGNSIKRSKPDPEVFLLAADRLGLPARECLVVEDADAGIQAAVAANMQSLGVGAASHNPAATIRAASLSEICLWKELHNRPVQGEMDQIFFSPKKNACPSAKTGRRVDEADIRFF